MMRKMIGLIGLLCVSFIINALFGSIWIHPIDAFNVIIGRCKDPLIIEIVLNYRLPKSLAGLFIGAALALSGVLMQTIFKNPLAGPDVLGVNSGAALGVAIFTMVGSLLSASLIATGWGAMISALVGALVVLSLILFVSKYIKSASGLLIAGIMFGYLTGSIISIIQSISNPDALKLFIIWTFGSLNGIDWTMLSILIPILFIAMVLTFTIQKSLNAFLLGENYAWGLGINISRIRIVAIILTACMAGVSTMFAGPIAFLGVTVPHLARWYAHSSLHQYIIPYSLLIGASLLLICDSIAQLPGFAGTLPISAITSLFGAPIVIWIMLQKK